MYLRSRGVDALVLSYMAAYEPGFRPGYVFMTTTPKDLMVAILIIYFGGILP